MSYRNAVVAAGLTLNFAATCLGELGATNGLLIRHVYNTTVCQHRND